MEKRKAKCGGYGMFTGIYGVIGLGIILGVLLGFPFKPEAGWTKSDLAATLANGIALAYVLLAAIDWFVQWLALSKNPLPHDLDLSDRAVARERGAALAGGALIQRHIRRLLAAWGAGASGPQVAAMAGSQMIRLLAILVAETAAILVLVSAAAGFAAPGGLLTLGTGLMVLVSIVALARFQLASQTAGYIESHLLARIGNDTPSAAGVEFAQAVAKSVADSTASLAAAQAKFAEQLAKSQDQAAAQIAKAQQEAAGQVAKAQGDMTSKLASAQQEGASQLAKAQDKISEQLGRIAALAGTIDNVLKLQQAVDGTLKGVAVTDEFKSTLVELKRHLAESDALLKNAARPRTIRLVEKGNE